MDRKNVMKALCKKNTIMKSIIPNIEFIEGNLYDCYIEENYIILKGERCDIGYLIPTEYFYTPEETKNILRIKLINKMIC